MISYIVPQNVAVKQYFIMLKTFLINIKVHIQESDVGAIIEIRESNLTSLKLRNTFMYYLFADPLYSVDDDHCALDALHSRGCTIVTD